MTDKTSSVSPDLKARGFTDEQIAATRSQFASRFNGIESCGLRFKKPFDHLKFEPFSYVLELFDGFERGYLPFEGPLSAQPAQIMDIFAALKQLKHELQLKLRPAQASTNVNGRNQYQNNARHSR